MMRLISLHCKANQHGHCTGWVFNDSDQDLDERCECDCHEQKREVPA